MVMKLLQLFHPDCKGEKVWVLRGWWGQRFYPRGFATYGECKKYREMSDHIDGKNKPFYSCHKNWIRNPNGVVIK